MPLTALTVRNSQASDKPQKLSDEKGLLLIVMPNGSKYWRLKYRFARKEKTLALGVYPEVSLTEARARRDAAKKILEEGADPSATMSKAARSRAAQLSSENSFESIAREWLTNIRSKWTGTYYKDSLRRFELHIFPEVGHISIKDIKAPQMLAAARKIEQRGTIESAHKIMRSCGQVFRYAIASGRCEHNPVGDLRGALKPKPEVKHVAALSRNELPDLLRKIDQYANSAGELQTQLALKLLALTFVRTGELRGAQWSEIDLNLARWTIPAERMKMNAPHVVPLSRQAIEVLTALHAINGQFRYVFAGRTPSVPMSKNTILFALYRMGFHKRMTGHGFRAVASTLLNEMNFNSDWIERQLAHAPKNKVRAAYHRAEYLEERAKMMQAWADVLDNLTHSNVAMLRSNKAA